MQLRFLVEVVCFSPEYGFQVRKTFFSCPKFIHFNFCIKLQCRYLFRFISRLWHSQSWNRNWYPGWNGFNYHCNLICFFGCLFTKVRIAFIFFVGLLDFEYNECLKPPYASAFEYIIMLHNFFVYVVKIDWHWIAVLNHKCLHWTQYLMLRCNQSTFNNILLYKLFTRCVFF